MKRTNENQNHFLLRTAMMLCVMAMTLFAPSKAGSTPVVQVETCEGGPGYIHVKGWAYDPDNQDCSLDVLVSVYARPNYDYLDTYQTKANIARTDVSALNGIPGNHGFETDIPLSAGTYYILFTVFNRNNDDKRDVFIDNVTVTASQSGTVTLTPETRIVNLGDGAVLTGTGGENTHVSIVDGATVTLSGVNISAISNDNNHKWAGITCLGDATIILADGTTNTVKGGDEECAGIQVGPPGKTLTIRGNGSLLAQSNGYCYGAGIGSGSFDAIHYYACGNIVIEGGNITAYGSNSPAIGAAQLSSCGTITIKGGTVYAESWEQAPGIGSCNTKCSGITIIGGTVTAKSKYGPAIGSSTGGTCGNITITGGTVTATKGASSRYCIGADKTSSCGTITIGGVVVDGVTVETFVYNSETTACYVSFNKNANSATGTMTNELFFSTTAQPLNPCSFSLTGYNYLGWNTEADGSGTSYSDGQTITVTNDMTLFAQWGKIYTVTFNANKGSGSMAAQAYTESISQDLTANTFTRTGYDFAGWNTEADGNGTSYSDEEAITVTSDMTLYAQWQPHAYNINYNLDGSTNNSSNPATYTIESDAITLAEPTRFGFVFDGWTWEGQTTPTKNVTIAHGSTGDKTYTAHWTIVYNATLTPETGDAVLYNGHVLTGTGGTNTHVVIKNGATVTLAGMTITDIPNDNDHNWAGITCEGDATIILADGTTNNVKGGNVYYPGITASYSRSNTLTIQGSGTLYASSNGSAGIGPVGNNFCGNIVIKGGTIIATAGTGFAGIGGIYCGDITITDEVTSVTSIAGDWASYSIGSAYRTVTIGGVVTGNFPQSTFTYNPSDTTPYTVTFDANGGEGTKDQNFISNTPQALTANTFTREGYKFEGWNTKADGTGTNYNDGQTVIKLGNMTLYAKWWPIDVTKITTATNYIELGDGDKISGIGGDETHVVIKDGATVTLKGVDLTNTIDSYEWAGITCLGDATIILEDGTTNTVAGGLYSPGIFVPEGHTLTISGDGTLTATGFYGAGIGGGYEKVCGNITITGGTITATGDNSAGIGCGRFASCGDIIITGGTINATGGKRSAGIGCGFASSAYSSTCGNITIARTVTSVTATKGEDAKHSIGEGKDHGVCGTVTIGGMIGPVSESPYTYVPNGSLNSTIHFDANGGLGASMADWQFTFDGTVHAIPLCTFTAPEGTIFKEWNTAADGSGTSYTDGQLVYDIPNVTLYAQWWTLIVEITTATEKLTILDGQTLIGTGGKNTQITIADGATVTFSDVDITDLGSVSSRQWPGITCAGAATIILSGENAVKGGYRSAGIFVPEGHTLTIRGDGSLKSTGQAYSAGIGGNKETSCGNIVIEGGTITATGGSYATGIGSGQFGSCGNITITGGSVKATSGSNSAAIGCGDGSSANPSSCGDITITGGVRNITATKRSSTKSINIIGTSGTYATCGTITIDPSLIDVAPDRTRYITAPDWTGTTNVTLAKEGYGTYYGPFDLVLTAGMKAYIVTASADGGKLTYETIANGNTTNNIVPALTAVMLQVASGDEAQTIGLTLTSHTAADIAQTNLLHGSDRELTISDAGDGTKYYKLTYNENGENLGWYWGKDDGAAFISRVNKAWLALPASAGAREFFGLPDFEETSDIKHETLNIKRGDGEWYDLQGRKVANGQKPKAKGLYIVNGKKVVIK